MPKFAILFFVMVATPMLSQVEPSATGGPTTLDDTRMMSPPPISGGVYPATVGAESRSNLISGGIVVTGAYNDNILADLPQKVSDSNYSIVPTISIDRQTPRQSELLTYSSGFTLYQKTSNLNGITQNGSGEYQLHLSRYAVLSVRDSFQQNNNLFNQANPFILSGSSIGTANSVYIFPFQNLIQNSLDAGIEYQYGKNAMIGAGGTYGLLRYANVSSDPGLDNANVGEASAFINRRVSRGQYLGLIYEFSRINTEPVQTTTDTNTVFGYYTKYFTNTVSVSVMGGPQHYSSQDPTSGASSEAWTPAVQGSAGYQTARTNITANYSRSVSGAQGLIGAYLSDTAGLSARRQIAHTWGIGINGIYGLFKNVTPSIASSNPGGHTETGTASLQHRFTERLRAEVGYSRLHQSYANLGATAQLYPDSNREYASLTYQFSKPIGR